VDVRIVAATNRKMEEAIATEKFRSDLYYRISEVSVNVPPLREAELRQGLQTVREVAGL